MMIDKTRIAGDAAYLRVPGNRDVNLASIAGSAGDPAVSMPLTEGMQLDVAAIDLLIEGDHLERRLALGEADLAFGVRKELFPGLFTDPFNHRVHTIAGFEDLQRGNLRNLEVLEVDGYATLVSTGAGHCTWESAIYHVPHAEDEVALFTAAAWDMGSSRLASREGLEYRLAVRFWYLGTAAQVVFLAGQPDAATPAAPRFREAPPGIPLLKVKSFQILFQAEVHQDGLLGERHVGEGVGHSLGRPLLRAINLLESVDSAFRYRSLSELTAAADAVKCVEGPPGNIKAITCRLPLRASLSKGEHLTLVTAAGMFERLEARIDGTLTFHPFDPDRKP